MKLEYLLMLSFCATVFVLPASAQEDTVGINFSGSVPGCEDTNTCFIPYNLHTTVGNTVNWVNLDQTAHTVASGSHTGILDVFNSGMFFPGDSFSYTFENTGTYPYFCIIHPWMEGIITVDDALPEKDTVPKLSYRCEDPKKFFSYGMISSDLFEDFEKYCLYVNGSQDENFSYVLTEPKNLEKSLYGITSDDALGKNSLSAMLSVKHTDEGSVENIDVTNNGDLRIASFASDLYMLSADVYAKNLLPPGGPTGSGSLAKLTITYHTDDGDKAAVIVPHYNGYGEDSEDAISYDMQYTVIVIDDAPSQMNWKSIKYDIRNLYNKHGLGNYDFDVTHWTLSMGGIAYAPSLDSTTSWSVSIDNLAVYEGNSIDNMPSIAYQQSVGVKPQNIICPDSKELAFKTSDIRPVCINESSLQRIYDMGYAIPADTSNKIIKQSMASKKEAFIVMLNDHLNEQKQIQSTFLIQEILNYAKYAEEKKDILNEIPIHTSHLSFDSRLFATQSGSLERAVAVPESGFNRDDSASSDFRESRVSEGMSRTPVTPHFGSGVPHMGGFEGMSLQYTDSLQEFSTTNLHVLGVDEPDFVKNNAHRLYVISNENDIAVVDTDDPNNLELLSESSPHNDTARYVILYGDMLLVLSDVDKKTEVTILDVTENPPTKRHHLILDSPLYDARMIGDTLYVMTQSVMSDNVNAPYLYDKLNSDMVTFRPAIHYFPQTLDANTLHSVTAIKITDDGLEADSDSFLLGASDTVYVSENNIYFSHYLDKSDNMYALFDMDDVIYHTIKNMDILDLAQLYGMALSLGGPDDNSIKYDMVQFVLSNANKHDTQEQLLLKYDDLPSLLSSYTGSTSIHKITLDGVDIEYVASGNVKGTLLNQFALDQKGYTLRAATSFRENGILQSNVYVLDSTLNLVGSLEGIAPGETLHSTRFAGDWLYLVTFRQVDPFFVIDVSGIDPKIMGELKIPGYSQYLQNYDENHVIGIGRDTNRNQFDETLDAGVKMSMFDVTDFENPVEIQSVIIGDHNTDSAGLVEHKALLIDSNKKIISIPIKFGDELFFYVYAVNDDYTLQEHSKIPHSLDPQNPQHMRSLYIGDTLYTVTPAMVKSNSLLQHDDSLDVVLLGVS